jgi:hypothetical protein
MAQSETEVAQIVNLRSKGSSENNVSVKAT